jgi:hypothetical protein
MRIRDTCIHGTDTRDMSGVMDIVAGTHTDTTGVVDDMFTGVLGGRRRDGLMAVTVAGATVTGSQASSRAT